MAADLETVDVSVQKPNITRKIYNLGDGFTVNKHLAAKK